MIQRTWSKLGFGTTLILGMGTTPIVLFALAALAPHVTSDLRLSRTQLGLTSTIAFAIAALLSTMAGKIIESLGARRTLLLLFGSAALAILVVVGSEAYWWLLVAAAVSGLGQSLSNPVTNYLVARNVEPGRRGIYIGSKQSGVQLCQFLVGVTLPVAAIFVGWRTATGWTAFLAGAGMVLTFRTMPKDLERIESAEVQVGNFFPISRQIRALAVFALLMGAAYQAVTAYLPLYSFEAVGMSTAVAGATTGVMGGVGCLARISWGWSGEQTSHLAGVFATIAVGAALATALLASATRGASAMLWIGIILHAITSPASNVVVMLALLRITPVAQLGRSSGVVALGMYIGFASGPLAVGMTIDHTGAYRLGWALVIVLYLVAAMVGLLAFRSSRLVQAELGSASQGGSV